MTVYRDKKSGLYRYDFRMAGVRYTDRGYPTQAKAKAAEAEAKKRLLVGLTGTWPTFSDLLRDWLEHLASRGVNKHTMAQSVSQFNKWLAPLATRAPSAITAIEVQRLLAHCARQTSPVNANAVRKQLRSCFSYAVRLGGLDRNPAALARPFPEPARRAADVDAIPTTHLRAIIVAAEPWMQRFLVVQALTGARWVEIVRLRPEDCHLDADPPHVTLRHFKGGERERRRVLPAPAADALRQQMQHARAYLWPGRGQRTPLGYSPMLKWLHRAADAAGVPRYSFHAIRRWAATTATVAGMSDRIVAEFLGHADTTTVHHYQRIEDPITATVSAALAAELAR